MSDSSPNDRPPVNVLVLYASQSTYTSTVSEHLDSFRRFSRHRYHYADAVGTSRCGIDLDVFDAVVLHYSTALYHRDVLGPGYAEALRRYAGPKLLFIQDEYETTEVLRQNIEGLGISVVFTCVPEQYVDNIYPRARFPGVEFVQNLTGYVPASLETARSRRPIAGRQWAIGYRGRPLHVRFGRLGQEKITIGKRMRAICEERGVSCNIDWTEESRIYWDDWYRFLADCKTTLGSESGSNVFDDDGQLRAAIDRELASNPAADFEAIHAKFLVPHEGTRAVMNQISPRIFEAVAMGTALVLFDGEYSGVVRPWEHFIPLRKDFSNIDEVLKHAQDDAFLQAMADRAYRDVIESGRYGYPAFIRMFDAVLDRHLAGPARYQLFTAVVAAQRADTRWTLGAVADDVAEREMNEHLAKNLRIFPLDATLTNTATQLPMFYMDRRGIWFAQTTPAQRIAQDLRLGFFGYTAVRVVLPLWRAIPRGWRVKARDTIFKLLGRGG